MFDISKRGSGRQEGGVDDELEQDRLGNPPRSGGTGGTGAAASGPAVRVREAAIIGPSIHIEGDLRGEEDLVIEGTVSGTIHLRDNGLTVGSNGKVKAEVHAKSIVVDGTLEGDLYGSERVAIRKSGQVRGNIVSPRVSLDDGGRFKGTIEMDQQAVDKVFGNKGGSSGGGGSTGASASPGSAGGEAGSGEASGKGSAAKETVAKETGGTASTAGESASGASQGSDKPARDPASASGGKR